MAKKKGVARGLPANVFQAVKKETTRGEAAGLAKAFRQERKKSPGRISATEKKLIKRATRIGGQAIPGRETVPRFRSQLKKRAASPKRGYGKKK